MVISPAMRAAKFWVTQTAPPALMFCFVFGRLDIGASLIVGPPLLYSTVRVIKLVFMKSFRELLRPALTMIFALTWIGMGAYYSRKSVEYVKQVAHEMQDQCNRDHECKLPAGDWKQEYPGQESANIFSSKTQGLVPFGLTITFNESEPTKAGSCADRSPMPACAGHKMANHAVHTVFHLVRQLEDGNYEVYVGVGRSLNIPE
jgi:hypothetical protein